MSLHRVIRDVGTLAAVVGQAVLENLWPAQAVKCALDKDYARAVTASAAEYDRSYAAGFCDRGCDCSDCYGVQERCTAEHHRFPAAEEQLNEWESENEVFEPLDEPDGSPLCYFCGAATTRTVNTDDGPEFVCADCDDPEADEDATPQTEAQWLGNTDDVLRSGGQTYQTSAASAEPPAGVDASPKQSPGGYPNLAEWLAPAVKEILSEHPWFDFDLRCGCSPNVIFDRHEWREHIAPLIALHVVNVLNK